jgi:hypothetical protein
MKFLGVKTLRELIAENKSQKTIESDIIAVYSPRMLT